MMIRIIALSVMLSSATSAAAEPLRVVADIAPINSLVAQIMGDDGIPTLLLPPDADPHHYVFRPSDAALIEGANVVVIVGGGLTPWLHSALETLAMDAEIVELAEGADWPALPLRGDDHDHDHGGDSDPHGWLNPQIAGLWAEQIARALVAANPTQEATYRDNLAALLASLADVNVEISAKLAPLQGKALLWPHEGYQYFEAHFGLASVGSIAATDGQSPGPAHIAQLRELVGSGSIACVLTDATLSGELAELVAETGDIPIVSIDNMGRGLEADPMAYQSMLMQLADQIATCANN